MANLKDLFSAFDSSSLEFRNNNEPASDGTLWANAFVKDNQDRLICIGATVETLNKIKDKKFDGFSVADIKDVVIRADLYGMELGQAIDELQADIEKFKKNFSNKKSMSMGFGND